jgi:superfamily I DNA and/or RNA helicase
MCMEPEVLIPLVNCKPQQIVLVGDHRQLRPIILCCQARRLGMERSLFERWAKLFESEQDNSQRAFVMLDKQYRMVRTCLLCFLTYCTASLGYYYFMRLA